MPWQGWVAESLSPAQVASPGGESTHPAGQHISSEAEPGHMPLEAKSHAKPLEEPDESAQRTGRARAPGRKWGRKRNSRAMVGQLLVSWLVGC